MKKSFYPVKQSSQETKKIDVLFDQNKLCPEFTFVPNPKTFGVLSTLRNHELIHDIEVWQDEKGNIVFTIHYFFDAIGVNRFLEEIEKIQAQYGNKMTTQKEINDRQNELREQAKQFDTTKKNNKFRGTVVREKKTAEELRQEAIEAGIL